MIHRPSAEARVWSAMIGEGKNRYKTRFGRNQLLQVLRDAPARSLFDRDVAALYSSYFGVALSSSFHIWAIVEKGRVSI